jgi:uncharacterized protein YndB with AHSA1/START domain
MTTDGTGLTGSLVGSVLAVGGKAVVHMEDRFDTSIEDLWSAITEPARLARWIARVEGDFKPGGEFYARFTSTWEGPGRVDVCEPPRRLLVTMEPGQDEETVIEAILTPDGDHTRLVVEDRGLPVDVAPSHGAGWQAHLEDLATYLAGEPNQDWKTRWLELSPAYREKGVS